ncbi:MAG TPA: hypothetical protein VF541_14230 [Longimicrobium sp.]
MKKLKLAVDTLAVESFRIDGGAATPGTVRAHDKTLQYDTCGCSADYNTQCCTAADPTCGTEATCRTSCNAGGPCTCPYP